MQRTIAIRLSTDRGRKKISEEWDFEWFNQPLKFFLLHLSVFKWEVLKTICRLAFSHLTWTCIMITQKSKSFMNLMCNPGQIMKAKLTKSFKIKKYIHKIKLKWEAVFYNTALKTKITTGSMKEQKEGREREISSDFSGTASGDICPVPGTGPLPSSLLRCPPHSYQIHTGLSPSALLLSPSRIAC